MPVRDFLGDSGLDTGYEFATRLDSAMRKAGFKSQSALARASGVPQPTINRLLKRPSPQGPEYSTSRKLARACGVQFDWLVNGRLDTEPIRAPLTEKQSNWLALLENLGTDDIAEFSELIAARQARNLRLLQELAGGAGQAAPSREHQP